MQFVTGDRKFMQTQCGDTKRCLATCLLLLSFDDSCETCSATKCHHFGLCLHIKSLSLEWQPMKQVHKSTRWGSRKAHFLDCVNTSKFVRLNVILNLMTSSLAVSWREHPHDPRGVKFVVCLSRDLVCVNFWCFVYRFGPNRTRQNSNVSSSLLLEKCKSSWIGYNFTTISSLRLFLFRLPRNLIKKLEIV